MSYSLIQDVQRRARKRHRCIWCGETIAVAEVYRYECSSYDGHMQHFHWHSECRTASDGFFRAYGEEEFEPYAFVRGNFEERS